MPYVCGHLYASPPPEPVSEPQDEVIVLSDLGKVLFAFNSAELTPDARELLAGISPRLVDGSVQEVMVKGHTDSVGADAYNDKLSLRRAESVAAYLVSQGVAADKVKTAGLGESQPLADNGSDAGRAQNRRVEIFVDR